jgi:hypothetical protein
MSISARSDAAARVADRLAAVACEPHEVHVLQPLPRRVLPRACLENAVFAPAHAREVYLLRGDEVVHVVDACHIDRGCATRSGRQSHGRDCLRDREAEQLCKIVGLREAANPPVHLAPASIARLRADVVDSPFEVAPIKPDLLHRPTLGTLRGEDVAAAFDDARMSRRDVGRRRFRNGKELPHHNLSTTSGGR